MKTKEDIRKVLSVSGATISNWVKTGLIPDYASEEKGYSDSIL
jgi:predicted site-specific integrase-resolvase